MSKNFKKTLKDVQIIVLSYINELQENKTALTILQNDKSWKFHNSRQGMTFKFLDYNPRYSICCKLSNTVNALHHRIVDQREDFRSLMNTELGSVTNESYKLMVEKFKNPQKLNPAEISAYINHYLYEAEELLQDLIVPLQATIENSSWTQVDDRYQFNLLDLDARIYFDRVAELNAKVLAALNNLQYGLKDYIDTADKEESGNC